MWRSWEDWEWRFKRPRETLKRENFCSQVQDILYERKHPKYEEPCKYARENITQVPRGWTMRPGHEPCTWFALDEKVFLGRSDFQCTSFFALFLSLTSLAFNLVISCSCSLSFPNNAIILRLLCGFYLRRKLSAIHLKTLLLKYGSEIVLRRFCSLLTILVNLIYIKEIFSFSSI